MTAVAFGGGWQDIDYPEAPRGDVVDDYFGTPVADPYRWLEDVDSQATRAWVEAQMELWEEFIGEVPIRDSIRARMDELYDYDRLSTPSRREGRYFYYTREAGREHQVYRCSDSLDTRGRVLVDPNGFEDSRRSLTYAIPSDDGRLLAWASSTSGSDWNTLHVMDVETGESLPDTLTWLKSGVSWASDGSGFYYTVFDRPGEGEEYTERNRNQRVMFHRLGTPQETDSLVYSRPEEPDRLVYGFESEDGRYLIIYMNDVNIAERNAIHYIDLQSEDREEVELLPDFDAGWGYVGNVGEEFYFTTDLDAAKGRVVMIDLSAPSRDNWVEVVPEAEENLEGASLVNDSRSLVLRYSWGGWDRVKILNLEDGGITEPELPGKGSVWGFGGWQDDREVYYAFTSFLHPSEIYLYDFRTGKSELVWQPEVDADLSAYRQTEVFYESFDGTTVPMFIVHPADVELDGTNPTILSGYGGFGIPATPYFSATRLAWLELGGILATPGIRGGGEYGEEWHLAGVQENRSVVFGDFIEAAEYLIEEGWTSTPHLGIRGGSNGGTLVAACLNMRPDLFGAAVSSMGVMDLMRYHLFTIGWYWKSEYGDPENPEHVEFLLEYSPYHNIAEGIEYPPTLISTADHDDRVVPGHSFKYGARLQAAQAGDAPILMSITSRAGHGGAVGRSEALDRRANEYAFFWETLGMGE
jgi:prolyl oligopeptidase